LLRSGLAWQAEEKLFRSVYPVCLDYLVYLVDQTDQIDRIDKKDKAEVGFFSILLIQRADR